MSQSSNSPLEVLLLDFWSDRNRGDAAMQIALARLLRQQAPGCRLTVMAAYGANQWPEFLAEMDETDSLVDEIVGGFKPTFVPFGSAALENRYLRRASNGVGSLVALVLAVVWPLIARCPSLDRFLPRALRASVAAVRRSDVVIWNGRNFRSDSATREPYEIWTLLYNPNLVAAFGKPIASIGASVWPLKRPASERMLQRAFRHTYFASFREESSYAYASDILGEIKTDVRLLPDLSLAVLTTRGENPGLSREYPVKPQRIGLTVVDWVNSGIEARDGYVAAVRGLIDELLTDPGVSITVIPQVTYEMEGTASLEEEVLDGLPRERAAVATGRPSVDELVDEYAKLDFLVATRMHSAIFASSQGTPVMTIPYDAGGKWGILSMMGVKDVDVPFVEATAETLTKKFWEVWDRREAIRTAVAERMPRLADEVEQNISVPLDILAAESTAKELRA